MFFFFKQMTAYDVRISDWSSDVCSSDLWFSPVVIVVIGFLAAIPWLKQQNDTFVLALTAVASIFVIGYALFISHRLQRHLDEVQIASDAFARSRCWVWGAMATVKIRRASCRE